MNERTIRALLVTVATALLVAGLGLLLWGGVQIGLGYEPQGAVVLIIAALLIAFRYWMPRPSQREW